MNTVDEIKKLYQKVGIDLDKLPHYSDAEEFGKQLAAKNRKHTFQIYTIDGTKDLNQNDA